MIFLDNEWLTILTGNMPRVTYRTEWWLSHLWTDTPLMLGTVKSPRGRRSQHRGNAAAARLQYHNQQPRTAPQGPSHIVAQKIGARIGRRWQTRRRRYVSD